MIQRRSYLAAGMENKRPFIEVSSQNLDYGRLNVTPDSFSDGGSYPTVASAVERALEMERQGAISSISAENPPGRIMLL